MVFFLLLSVFVFGAFLIYISAFSALYGILEECIGLEFTSNRCT